MPQKREISLDVCAKLALCTIKPGASEDDAMRVFQDLGLEVAPVQDYYNLIALASSEENQAEVARNVPFPNQTVTATTTATTTAAAKNDAKEKNINKNPISELKELCEKAQSKQPVYTLENASRVPVDPQWKCTLSVTDFGPNKKNYRVSATAAQKQQAKSKAAQTLLKKLKAKERQSSQPIVSGQAINRSNVTRPKILADSIPLRPVSRPVKPTEIVSTSSNVAPTIDDLRSKQTLQKRPTQVLNEYCQQFNLQPIYNPVFRQNEFAYTVIAGNNSGTGFASTTKKDSKENAALDVLFKLKSKCIVAADMFKNAYGI